MSEPEYEQISDIFNEVRELAAPDQAAALDAFCDGNQSLRRGVMALLESDRGARREAFMERTGLEDAALDLAQQTSMLPRPETVLGKYKLRRQVGAGGMGFVYEAMDLVLDRRVAVKILSPMAAGHAQERLRRFQYEGKAAAQFTHPNIAAVYDAGSEGGFAYIVMEFVEGKTLRELIEEQRGTLSQALVLDIVAQVALALSAAHAAGIVHGDIKPENVMRRRDGFVKVLDFGLASTFTDDKVTQSGPLAGTFLYLSPEQLAGGRADERSDLFSLAVVAYEMTTGVRPFGGAGDAEVYNAILHGEPIKPSKLRSELSRAFDELLLVGLKKKPELRYQTALEVRQACEALRDRLRRPARLWRRGALAAAGLSAAALAIWEIAAPPVVRPQVNQILQITKSDQPVIFFAMHAGKLYYADGPEDASIGMYEMGTDGGEPRPLPQFAGKFPLDISPDGKQMLLGSFSGGAQVGPYPLWIAHMNGTARPLTGLVGQFARWSPNGTQIVFSSGGQLVVMRSDGVGMRTVVQVNGYIEDAAWSPDEKRLRFTVSVENARHIWEVQSDGTGLKQMFSEWNQPWAEMGRWTNNGNYFLFSAGRSTHDLWALRERKVFGREIASTPTRLTHGPLWSFRPHPEGDGSKVYFVGTSNISQLVRLDARTGEWLPFLNGMNALQVDFSADGKSIVYVDSNGSLWRSAADGSQRMELTAPPVVARNPRWSPEGSRIVFYGAPIGLPDAVYTVPASGGAVNKITDPGVGVSERDPTWSPDGKEIIFDSTHREIGRTPSVYRMNVATRRIESLPQTAHFWSPRWSPDGRHLAVLDAAAHLNMYDLATHESVELTTFAAGYPVWSHDGSAIYFENNSSSAWFRVGLKDRKVELVRKLNGLKTAVGGSGWVGMMRDGTLISARAVSASNIYALEWDDR